MNDGFQPSRTVPGPCSGLRQRLRPPAFERRDTHAELGRRRLQRRTLRRQQASDCLGLKCLSISRHSSSPHPVYSGLRGAVNSSTQRAARRPLAVSRCSRLRRFGSRSPPPRADHASRRGGRFRAMVNAVTRPCLREQCCLISYPYRRPLLVDPQRDITINRETCSPRACATTRPSYALALDRDSQDAAQSGRLITALSAIDAPAPKLAAVNAAAGVRRQTELILQPAAARAVSASPGVLGDVKPSGVLGTKTCEPSLSEGRETFDPALRHADNADWFKRSIRSGARHAIRASVTLRRRHHDQNPSALFRESRAELLEMLRREMAALGERPPI